MKKPYLKKYWVLGVGLIAIAAVVGLAGCSNGSGPGEVKVSVNSQSEGIWVNGTGEVSAVPDLAIVSLGVSVEKPTVAEAQVEAANAMNRLMQALKDNGVEPKDIQTQYFNISQVTRWNDITRESEITGYMVSNTVSAKIRDMEKAGTIIDAVAVAGGDYTRVNGISFSIEDPADLYQQARQKAIANAKAKAEQMASLMGVTLGKVTYMTENSYIPTATPVYYKEAAAGAMDSATSISPGETKISASVQVVYGIS